VNAENADICAPAGWASSWSVTMRKPHIHTTQYTLLRAVDFVFTSDKKIARMYAYTRRGVFMAITKVFKNGNSQAVRIPAELAYERHDLDVEIERVGDEIRIRPSRRSLGQVLSKFAQFSAGFMDQGRGGNQESERDVL